jgi:putative hydrolase
MDDPGDELPQSPFGDALGDVPLFRELQRVLLSGTGPVNWELARQVAIAVGAMTTPDPAPSDDARREFEEFLRAVELEVARFTGMEPPPGIGVVRLHRRATWIEANMSSLKPLVEPVAARLAQAMARMQDEAPAAEMPLLEALMDKMAPLLLGAQMGTVLGSLGQRALGHFDVAVPRDTDAISLVVSNITDAEREWSLAPTEFRAWVTVHEVAHRFAFARPWVAPHFAGLVHEFTDGSEFDMAGMEERLSRLDLSDPERLNDALGNPGELVGRVLTDEGRLQLARVQAFIAVAEGFGDHVLRGVSTRMLKSHEQIREAMRRRREGEAGDTRLVEQLLGIETTPEQYELGRAFCDTVAERTDEATLSRMWDSAESLPSMPELEEPTLWLSRMA